MRLILLALVVHSTFAMASQEVLPSESRPQISKKQDVALLNFMKKLLNRLKPAKYPYSVSPNGTIILEPSEWRVSEVLPTDLVPAGSAAVQAGQ